MHLLKYVATLIVAVPIVLFYLGPKWMYEDICG